MSAQIKNNCIRKQSTNSAEMEFIVTHRQVSTTSCFSIKGHQYNLGAVSGRTQ